MTKEEFERIFRFRTREEQHKEYLSKGRTEKDWQELQESLSKLG